MKKSHNIMCSLLPQRVVMGIMGFLAIAVSYTIRACLSVTIVEMAKPVSKQENQTKGADGDDGKYDWDQELQGWILASFYIGYVITHIPGGLLAQKFGGKWTMAIGILWMAILNAITPFAVQNGGGYIALIILRILMGLGGGTTYPALSVMLAAWVPAKERGKLGSVVFGGGQIGSLASFLLSGLILKNHPWTDVFYFWSIIAIIWFILFVFICHNDPESHPFITERESNYLKKEMGQIKRNDDLPPTPWISIITSVPVLALTVAQLGHDWVFYIISAYLPKYLKDVLEMETYEVGIYASIPFLAMWIVSLVSGFISDFLITRNYITITQGRKIFTAIGAVFPAIFIMAASYAGYDKVPVIIWFTFTVAFLGNFYPGLKVNALDLTPNYAGSLMALTNGIGGFTGIAVPPFVGRMTPDSTLEQWRMVFWITFIVSMARIVVFIIWGSAEVQPWNNPREKLASPECGLSNEVPKEVEAAKKNTKETKGTSNRH